MINFSGALDSLRNLRAAAQDAGSVQIEQGLIDLQEWLLNVQIQVLEQQVDARLLQSETHHLRDLLSTARSLERVNEAYYLCNEERVDLGPYCVTCWDRREVLHALVEAGEGHGYCSHCKARKEARKPKSRMVTAA